MGIEERKKFELNSKILKNFDKIMSIKLDEVEELKITELDNGSKLINIVSLCANLKTLIIEGDQRINSDRVLRNIFKAGSLENLILNNVKLPKSSSMKKFENLKTISLNGIRGCDIREFFQNGIINKKCLENISIVNSDMLNNSMLFLKEFSNLKYLELNKLINCKFDDLSFIKKNNKLQKITLLNNEVPVDQVNNFLNFSGTQNIDIIIEHNNQKNLQLRVCYNSFSEIILPAHEIKDISKKINLYKINKIKLNIENGIDDFKTIKSLSKSRKEINFIVNKYSSLSIEQAKKIKSELKMYKFQVDEDGNMEDTDINTYIKIKEQIDEVISVIENSDNEIQKFLKIYKNLGQRINIAKDGEKNDELKKCNKKDVAKILYHCLQCVNIESNIIFGEELVNKEEHFWNQVKIDGKWYNIDLGLDIQNIKNRKTEYCLLDDEDFYELHTPKLEEKHYCSEEYNYKFVNVFIKTGLFKEQLLASYIEIMKLKFRKIFNSNKKETILALPSGEKDK